MVDRSHSAIIEAGDLNLTQRRLGFSASVRCATDRTARLESRPDYSAGTIFGSAVAGSLDSAGTRLSASKNIATIA